MEQIPPQVQAQNVTSPVPQATSQPLNQPSVQPSIEPVQIGQGMNPQSTNPEHKKRHRRSMTETSHRDKNRV